MELLCIQQFTERALGKKEVTFVAPVGIIFEMPQVATAVTLWLAYWVAGIPGSLGQQTPSGFVRVVRPTSPQNASFYFVRAGVKHFVPDCAICNGTNQCSDAAELPPTELTDAQPGSSLIGCDLDGLDKAAAPTRHQLLTFIDSPNSSSMQQWQQANAGCRAEGLSLCTSGQLCTGGLPSAMLGALGSRGFQPTSDGADSWTQFSSDDDTCSVDVLLPDDSKTTQLLCCAPLDLRGFDMM